MSSGAGEEGQGGYLPLPPLFFWGEQRLSFAPPPTFEGVFIMMLKLNEKEISTYARVQLEKI